MTYLIQLTANPDLASRKLMPFWSLFFWPFPMGICFFIAALLYSDLSSIALHHSRVQSAIVWVLHCFHWSEGSVADLFKYLKIFHCIAVLRVDQVYGLLQVTASGQTNVCMLLYYCSTPWPYCYTHTHTIIHRSPTKLLKILHLSPTRHAVRCHSAYSYVKRCLCIKMNRKWRISISKVTKY